MNALRCSRRSSGADRGGPADARKRPSTRTDAEYVLSVAAHPLGGEVTPP